MLHAHDGLLSRIGVSCFHTSRIRKAHGTIEIGLLVCAEHSEADKASRAVKWLEWFTVWNFDRPR